MTELRDATETDTDHDDEEHSTVQTISRRGAIAALAGLAGAGASGYFAGTAQAAPTGTFPQSSDAPLLKIRADRVRFVGRTSDPSSPSDGDIWYRSDL